MSLQAIADLGIKSIWDFEGCEVPWLVKDLLAEGSVNLLSAESGMGKTWVAYAIAGAVAHGVSFAERPTKRREVLYVDAENPLYAIKQRLELLGVVRTENLHIWGNWIGSPPGPEDGRLHELVAGSKEKPLLIWDSLIAFHGGDEQSATDTRRFMNSFRKLASVGGTVLVLHHTGKSEKAQEYRGSSDIKGSVDMAFKLEREKGGRPTDKIHRVILTPFKRRLAVIPPLRLEYRGGQGFTAVEPGDIELAEVGEYPPDVVERIVRERPRLSQRDIVAAAKEYGISKHRVEEALKHDPRFTIEKGSGRTKLYSNSRAGASSGVIPISRSLGCGNLEEQITTQLFLAN